MPPASGRQSRIYEALAAFAGGETFIEFLADERWEVGDLAIASGVGFL
ncbi:MAG: hypothetical protein ABJF10_01185 [Chthoniobacter sp.]